MTQEPGDTVLVKRSLTVLREACGLTEIACSSSQLRERRPIVWRTQAERCSVQGESAGLFQVHLVPVKEAMRLREALVGLLKVACQHFQLRLHPRGMRNQPGKLALLCLFLCEAQILPCLVTAFAEHKD